MELKENKEIYLKAEVVDENIAGNQTGIKIGNESFAYYVNKKDIEQAQVLAVEEVLNWLKKSRYDSIKIYEDESFGLDVIDGKSEPYENISELTSLVRGKTRTLEELFIELRESHQERDTKKFDSVMEEIREQLLKNRE